MYSTDSIIQRLTNSGKLDIAESFDFAFTCWKWLQNELLEPEWRTVLIYALDNWNKIPPETKEIWADLIESAGFYPYMEKEKEVLPYNSIPGKLRKELAVSQFMPDKYFHSEQKNVRDLLLNGKNTILSAPTSFWKSLLIEELIASKKYTNILVIQPTLALLDETRKKLKKYSTSYSLIVRTAQQPGNWGNIFLFTAERVMEYKDFPSLDLLVIDEFYKLSWKRWDDRYEVLNNAFYTILKKHSSCQFYLLWPNIESIRLTEAFQKFYGVQFVKTDYSLVATELVDVFEVHKNVLCGDKLTEEWSQTIKAYKEKVLFEILKDLRIQKEQSIVYCSSPAKARFLARSFTNYLKSSWEQPRQKELTVTSWIRENISSEWDVLECLSYWVAMHDGWLPKHLTSSFIDYFNNGAIDLIFCTTTIIEWVNTSAKNVLFFDNKKGKNSKIDYFDYSNIKWRAWRMMSHYVGRVFNFNPPIEIEETVIDIPFLEQGKWIPDEILIQLEEDDVVNPDSDQYKKLKDIPDDLKELIKENGVSVQGQLWIFNEISDLDRLYKYKGSNHKVYDLLYWNWLPKYEQLHFALELAWNYIRKVNETGYPIVSSSYLTLLIFNYYKNNCEIGWLIAHFKGKYLEDLKWLHENGQRVEAEIKEIKSKSVEFKEFKKTPKYKRWSLVSSRLKGVWVEGITQLAILDSLQFVRHWIGYAIPKWMSVINKIQKQICISFDLKPGNYSFYIASLENDFIDEDFAILIEYGLPKSAVEKIKKHIISNLRIPDLTEKKIIEIAKTDDCKMMSWLSEYEIEKIGISL